MYIKTVIHNFARPSFSGKILRPKYFFARSEKYFLIREKIFSHMRFFFRSVPKYFLERANFFLDVRKIFSPHRYVRVLPVWQKKDVRGVKKRLSHDFFLRRTIFFRRRTRFFRRTPDVFDVERRFSPHFLFCHNAGFCLREVPVWHGRKCGCMLFPLFRPRLIMLHLIGVNLRCSLCGITGIVYFFNTPGPQLLLPMPSTAASMSRKTFSSGVRSQSCAVAVSCCVE